MEDLDKYDKKLLRVLQKGLPVTARPYKAIGDECGLTEEDVISRIEHLMEIRVIRRLAGFFDSGKLGYKTVLCAASVKEENIDAFAKLLEGYTGVTHNYVREHPRLNVWFTLISPSKEKEDEAVANIESSGLVDRVERFYKKKLFKIRAAFEL